MMMFDGAENHRQPLSVRMRPRGLDEYVGQEHILSEGKLLWRAIFADQFNSLILYGPPGTGKTTLAQCICAHTKSAFENLNAVMSNVEEIRRVIATAKNRLMMSSQKTIVFIDEIHRFNKAQQDILMPDVENGVITLIGATTMNPFFALVAPLLSRSLVFELKSLSVTNLVLLLKRALQDEERGLGSFPVEVQEETLEFLARMSDGDARRALNALELAVCTTPAQQQGQIHITQEVILESIQKKTVLYDKNGDEHYDTISAFIKSMRGSDPDATVYWLAKMIVAGEDPRFIARRICICAAEDVGNADPKALLMAQSAMNIAEFVGLPEARIPLAQAALYVACSPKSNAVYLAIDKAIEDVKTQSLQKVPNHLKDGHYQGAQKLNRGQGYRYPHDYPYHYVAQEYMNQKKSYYVPTDLGYERKIKEFLKYIKSQG